VASPLRVVWVSSAKGDNDKSFEVLLPCRGKAGSMSRKIGHLSNIKIGLMADAGGQFLLYTGFAGLSVHYRREGICKNG
jgi:hypothetical protein